jgi:hypothetical protein
MKKTIFSFATIALFCLTQLSCKKDQPITEKKETQTSLMSSTATSYVPIDFTGLGDMHNKYLTDAINATDFSSPTWRDDLFSNFTKNKVDVATLGITDEQWAQDQINLRNEMESYGFDFRNAKNVDLNPVAKKYVDQVLDESERIENLSDFATTLASIQGQATKELSGSDLDLVRAVIIVAQSSATLWAPVSIGGKGFYDQLSNNAGQHGVPMPEGWRGALIGDASGACGAFMHLGIMGAIGLEVPGANLAIGVGIALDAAIGSGIGAFQ